MAGSKRAFYLIVKSINNNYFLTIRGALQEHDKIVEKLGYVSKGEAQKAFEKYC